MGEINYELNSAAEMLITKNVTSIDVYPNLTWGEIIRTNGNNTQHFFTTRFDSVSKNANKIIRATTTFCNPKTGHVEVVEPNYELDARVLNGNFRKYQGPIDILPDNGSYGIGLSPKLMKDLGLKDGDVVYFSMR
jgi:hypothetical protein